MADSGYEILLLWGIDYLMHEPQSALESDVVCESCVQSAGKLPPACGPEISTIDKVISNDTVMVMSSPCNLIRSDASQSAMCKKIRRMPQQALAHPEV